MYLSPRGRRLLDDVEASHRAFIEWADADESIRRGLRAVYEAMEAGLSEMTEDQLIEAPSAEEWSMAEVVEHVAEHDRKYLELEQHGIAHYVEHGLEHGLQLWRLRAALLEPPSSEDEPGGP